MSDIILESPDFCIKNRIDRVVEKIYRSLMAAISGTEKERTREREFERIMQEYGHVISGICFSFSSDGEDIKDLRQDIMINIWKGLSHFRGDSSLSTWIYRVALNTCVSTFRTKKKRLNTISLDNGKDIAADDHKEMEEQIEYLHSLISTLPDIDKAIVTMWLDERSYEEIAEVTGLNRNNVAVRLHRIKDRLAKNKE